MTAETIVNENERGIFLQSIKATGYAGLSEVQTIYHTMPIAAHRQAFINGKRGQRDGHRAALFMEAIQLKNATARVLAFFIALSRAGYKGSVCTEEVLAAQIVAATGGLCAPRTFRRALAELCRRGWLVKTNMSTGTKLITPHGWKTLQVNKITIPQCTRLLGVKFPRKFNTSDSVPASCPTPAKMASNGRKKVDTPPPQGGVSNLHIVNVEGQPAARNEESGLATAQPSAASPPPTSPPLKHQTTEESRVAGKAPKKGAAPFARRSRAKIPKTWHHARILFLHDLATALAGTPPAAAGATPEFLQRIADIQTSLNYPPLFPVALAWENYLPRWLEMDWKDRRRTITREILPDLRAWCAPWAPPPAAHLEPTAPESVRAAAKVQAAQYDRVSRLVSSLPDMLTDSKTPKWIAQKIADCRWQLSKLPVLLITGRIGLDDIRPGERQAFAEIADLLGMRD